MERIGRFYRTISSALLSGSDQLVHLDFSRCCTPKFGRIAVLLIAPALAPAATPFLFLVITIDDDTPRTALALSFAPVALDFDGLAGLLGESLRIGWGDEWQVGVGVRARGTSPCVGVTRRVAWRLVFLLIGTSWMKTSGNRSSLVSGRRHCLAGKCRWVWVWVSGIGPEFYYTLWWNKSGAKIL